MKQTVFMKLLTPRFHATMNSSKLGGKREKIVGVSKVPGKGLVRFKDGRIVSDCTGTCSAVDCSGCEKACYARRSFIQYPTVTVNRVENTMLARTDIERFISSIYEYAVKVKATTIRYTESGEIETYTELETLMRYAEMYPDINLYFYTKAYNFLAKYITENYVLPENVTVLLSIWGKHGVKEYECFKNISGIKAFVVNNADYKPDIICPAYHMVNGKVKQNKAVKCGNCKACTRARDFKVIGCYEH